MFTLAVAAVGGAEQATALAGTKFDQSHREVLTTQDVPTNTLNAPIVGEKAELTLEEAKGLRPQTVAFLLATHLQQHHFPDRPWLFPQLLGIVRDWLGEPDGDSARPEGRQAITVNAEAFKNL